MAALDRNASTPERIRRNFQRMKNGSITETLKLVANGGLELVNGQLQIDAGFFVTREVPSGAVDGVNAAFVLAHLPESGSEVVIVNGVVMRVGAGNDYTITGTTITFEAGAIPETGDWLAVNYLRA